MNFLQNQPSLRNLLRTFERETACIMTMWLMIRHHPFITLAIAINSAHQLTRWTLLKTFWEESKNLLSIWHLMNILLRGQSIHLTAFDFSEEAFLKNRISLRIAVLYQYIFFKGLQVRKWTELWRVLRVVNIIESGREKKRMAGSGLFYGTLTLIPQSLVLRTEEHIFWSPQGR